MAITRLFGVMFLLLSTSLASSQYVSVIDACSQDATKFCAPGQMDEGSLVECIKAHFQDFTEPCKVALTQIPEVLESCSADIQKQCSALEPSAGRVLICVKQNFAALSGLCKEAIGHAAERKVGLR